jgi:uncharacterized membrane protein
VNILSAAPPRPPTTPPANPKATWRTALALAGVAALGRLIPAVLAYGTSDVMTWELLGRLLLTGENFYATELHNWPALWIYFCSAAVLVHDATGLPFFTLIKLPAIAADTAMTLLIYRISLVQKQPATLLALAYALNPVSILISGYHGQFDSLMLAPTLLAVFLFGRGARSISALALGLGIWFKPVPLLLLPVLLPRLRTWRERVMFALLAVAPATLGTLPYLITWPEDVAANFLGYSSWFGQWGFPVIWMIGEFVINGTVPWWLPDPEHISAPLHAIYLASRWLLLAALAGTWWAIYRHRMELLRAISTVFAVFYVVTGGFGVQYLLWIIPFATARRDRWLWPFTIAATALLIVAYSLGAAYQPLETIPDNAPSGREFIVKLASLPAWIVSILWAWSLLRQNSTYNRVETEQA